MIITDLRNDSSAERQRELYKLAENILIWGMVWDSRPSVGAFVKKYGTHLNKLGMGELKAHHFNIAEWKIKKLMGK